MGAGARLERGNPAGARSSSWNLGNTWDSVGFRLQSSLSVATTELRPSNPEARHAGDRKAGRVKWQLLQQALTDGGPGPSSSLALLRRQGGRFNLTYARGSSRSLSVSSPGENPKRICRRNQEVASSQLEGFIILCFTSTWSLFGTSSHPAYDCYPFLVKPAGQHAPGILGPDRGWELAVRWP
jgi:hypothetical protein